MDKRAAHGRLIQAIDYLKDNGKARNHEEVSELTGISRPNITAALNGNERYVTLGTLRKFARAYSGYINEDWLLTGEGEMIKVDKRKFRPHISSDIAMVAASPMGTTLGSVGEDECEQRKLNDTLPDYDFTIEVNGDSMYPTIFDGDTIACKWLDSSEKLLEDKIYVIDTNEGAVVKRITRNRTSITCHSDNKYFEDYKISKSSILRIAQVVGLVRVF